MDAPGFESKKPTMAERVRIPYSKAEETVHWFLHGKKYWVDYLPPTHPNCRCVVPMFED